MAVKGLSPVDVSNVDYHRRGLGVKNAAKAMSRRTVWALMLAAGIADKTRRGPGP